MTAELIIRLVELIIGPDGLVSLIIGISYFRLSGFLTSEISDICFSEADFQSALKSRDLDIFQNGQKFSKTTIFLRLKTLRNARNEHF